MKRSTAKSQVANRIPELLFAAFLLGATMFTIVQTAHAQAAGDPVIAQARSAGTVGEQADGYVGIVAGQTVSAEVRSHVEQLNIRRRAAYTTAAGQANASVADFAAATACQRFRALPSGERYRNEAGAWASAPAAIPSFCSNH